MCVEENLWRFAGAHYASTIRYGQKRHPDQKKRLECNVKRLEYDYVVNKIIKLNVQRVIKTVVIRYYCFSRLMCSEHLLVSNFL